NYLTNKIKDQNLSFQTRKFAFFYLIEFLQKQDAPLSYKDFLDFLTHFLQKEEQTILGEVSNWQNSSNPTKKKFIHSLTVSFFRDHTIKNINPKLKNIIDINSRDEYSNSTVLMDLIKTRDITAVNKILKEGIDIHALNTYSYTALHLAVENGDPDIVEILLKYGANFDTKDNWGKTPAHLAVENRDKDIVEILLKYGANFDTKDNWGKTPAHLAVENRDKDIVEILLKYGANFDTKDNWGKTVLDKAIQNKDNEIFDLIRNGAKFTKIHNIL
ncbi:MAG: ankyrin repeat domain-containing protein, partial [Bdellovibrionaceae bacterium]|nr:ankyrin repeat domain-containing protein [Pseudobdellovibrionaceae bacterium]